MSKDHQIGADRSLGRGQNNCSHIGVAALIKRIKPLETWVEMPTSRLGSFNGLNALIHL